MNHPADALPLPEGWPARFRCDSCEGNGEIGEPMYMGHFQPPERARCHYCDGRGWTDEEPAFNSEHIRAAHREGYELAMSKSIEAASISAQRVALIRGWDERGKVAGLSGSVASDKILNAILDAYYPREALASQPAQEQSHSDPNAPWLTKAHMLCTDVGVPQGRIEWRLDVLRGLIESHQEQQQAGAAEVSDEQIIRVFHDNAVHVDDDFCRYVELYERGFVNVVRAILALKATAGGGRDGRLR